MFKILTLIVLVVVISDARDSSTFIDKASKNGRQKRLLFYDEEGNLVKTYKNPYMTDFVKNAENMPFLGNFFNPFFSFLRPSSFGGPTAYMIPVSDEVIQQINSDPVYQNKLLILPRKEMVVEQNPLCEGKRSQIPAKSCGNFLNCWDGWAFEQECPEGLMFSLEGYCDYPRNVECSTRSNAPVVTKSQCSNEFESFRHEHQCSEFFVCVNSVPIKFKCPADLAYNQELGICDYPYRVDCNASIASMDTPVASATPSKPNTMCSPTTADAASKEPPMSSTETPGRESQVPPAFTEGTPSTMSDVKSVLTNAVFNSQSWTLSHIAISRQDAIRQLQLGRIAKINAA